MVKADLFTISELKRYNLDEFLMSKPNTLIYYTPKYIHLIEKMTSASHKILAVIIDNKIEGILPFLEKRSDLGIVINSDPYYGSHGGGVSNNEDIEKALLDEFVFYCTCNKVLSATIIPSFDNKFIHLYSDFFSPHYKELRIGQYTSFEDISVMKDMDLEEALMNKLHYKTRNMVRKSFKSEIIIKEDVNDEILSFLEQIHVKNCDSVGIVPKSNKFFTHLKSEFTIGKDFKIFTAWHQGQPIAALLCLYYNKTVEYFVPVIVEEYRNLQPLSSIIFYAMKKAVQRGFIFWNWGGTSPGSEGVYRFKSRWGTIDKNYWYFTRVFNKKVFDLSKQDIIKNYPFFFVLPFQSLIKFK
jgi:hypothetical protein